jgi:hypothetical protein
MRIPRVVARLVVRVAAVGVPALLGALLTADPAQASTVAVVSDSGAGVWIVALIAAVLLVTGLALVLLRRLRRPLIPRSVRRSRD